MIACLGWGSLIWEPRDLPIRPIWFPNGPNVPVEFARQADDGTVAVVLCEQGTAVPCCWAEMKASEPAEAITALAAREQTPPAHGVGIWSAGDTSPALIPELSHWASLAGAEHVVWTALGPRFGGESRMPTMREVVDYLRGLSGEVAQAAERYVRQTPKQIVTPYRREIEAALGWTAA